jgi:hypothetical protein
MVSISGGGLALELVSRRCKRVVPCSFLITAGRKRSTLFRVAQRERSRRQIEKFKTTIAQNRVAARG